MIDHMYLSDHRGYAYRNEFDLIFNTSFINENGSVSYNALTTKTIELTILPDVDSSGSIMALCCIAIQKATSEYKKILLYSDNDKNTAQLVYTYLHTKYHFTPLDISRMISTRPFNKGLMMAFSSILSKEEDNHI